MFLFKWHYINYILNGLERYLKHPFPKFSMVEGRKKSRSPRKLKTRLITGKVVIHYYRRKPGKAQCGACGDNLKGVPRERPNTMHNLPRSCKRPQRPYGGVLCSRCSRKLIVSRVRSIFSLSSK